MFFHVCAPGGTSRKPGMKLRIEWTERGSALVPSQRPATIHLTAHNIIPSRHIVHTPAYP